RAFIFANFEAISRILGGSQDLSKNMFPLFIRCVILLFLVLALSGTMLIYTGDRTDFDFVLTIDSSSSMLADDYLPNRMEAAKDAAKIFVDSLGAADTRIGVLHFGGVVYTAIKPTSDLEAVKASIDSIQPSTAGGTAVGDALIASTNLFLQTDRGKVVVLLTDGQSNIGTPPLDTLNYTINSNIIVNTIGIGTQQGGKFFNLSIVSRLDEDSLRFIAERTGGNYFKVESEEELKDVYRQLAETTETRMTTSLSIYLVFIGLFLLVAEWILLNMRYRTLP
ncbi:MAG: VWA domain-containing protein, partial [Candidatus Altiarchaeota archaeon]|nr:VWA domain-containing protein [Candidatus Altiarchaeota archaeon]